MPPVHARTGCASQAVEKVENCAAANLAAARTHSKRLSQGADGKLSLPASC